jgi:hypothetical protein
LNLTILRTPLRLGQSVKRGSRRGAEGAERDGNREPREIRERFDHGFHGWTRIGLNPGFSSPVSALVAPTSPAKPWRRRKRSVGGFLFSRFLPFRPRASLYPCFPAPTGAYWDATARFHGLQGDNQSQEGRPTTGKTGRKRLGRGATSDHSPAIHRRGWPPSLQCGGKPPLLDETTCRLVQKRGPVRALQRRARKSTWT